VSVFIVADNLYDGWSLVCSESGLLRGTCVSYAGLRHVGARK